MQAKASKGDTGIPNEPEAYGHLQRVEHTYQEIAEELDEVELQIESRDELTLTEADLYGAGEGGAGAASQRFLGYYSQNGLASALLRYGLLFRIAARVKCSENDLEIRLDLEDPYLHRLFIYLKEEPELAPLAELRMRFLDHPREATISYLTEVEKEHPGRISGYICCEWLQLQNPKGQFTRERRRLPGQVFPGLGVGAEVMTLLWLMVRRLGRHALLAYPAYVHTALLYSARFRFLDPMAEGRLRALARDLGELGLCDLSWAVELGCVTIREGGREAPLVWQAKEQAYPASPRARAYFASSLYEEAVLEMAAAVHYQVDRDALRKKQKGVIG